MELSELQKFAGELLTVDDRSGVVYSIENDIVVPRHILVDGDGHSKKVTHFIYTSLILRAVFIICRTSRVIKNSKYPKFYKIS